MKTQKESKVIALLSPNLGARGSGGGQRHAPAALPPTRESVPLEQKAGWAPGPVLTGLGDDKVPFPPQKFEPRTVQPVASRHTASFML
jgi:hypothetical protein